ncbi:hypothetical protein [Flavobacterium album]|nr:hypothetical protein [Flavobacterium album]
MATMARFAFEFPTKLNAWELAYNTTAVGFHNIAYGFSQNP